MKTINTNIFRKAEVERQIMFLVKAAVFMLSLFLFGRLAPLMPPFCVLLAWIAMSTISAVGISYHYVIRKARNRYGLEDGGISARINGGRVVCLIVAFLLSTIATVGLIFEVPEWAPAEWIIFMLGIPLYMVIFNLVSRRAEKEWKSLLRVSKCIAISSFILFVVLLVLYLLVCLTDHAPSYESLAVAFMATKQPYAESSSVLLSDLGYINALVNGFTAFAMSRIAEGSFEAYIAWRIAICVGTILGLSSLIGTCSLKLDEMKLVFMPLNSVENKETVMHPIEVYIKTALVIPVLVICICVYTDAKVTEISQTDGCTFVKTFIRNQVGAAACVIDGIPYDPIAVQDVAQEMSKRSENLAEWRDETLVPLINETYDAHLANVDSYLDWYYSLPADYERLAQWVAGSVEDHVEEQFKARIEDGVDDSHLSEEMSRFFEEAETIRADFSNALSQHVIKDVPEWLLIKESVTTFDVLIEPLCPTQALTDWRARMGTGAAGGTAAGITSKVLTEKVVKKAFFSKAVTRIASTVGSRGAGAAVGGAAGTLGGPLGTAVGVVVGTGVGIGVDYSMLKIDEWQNREEYKAEIVEAIEEARADTLDKVNHSTPGKEE